MNLGIGLEIRVARIRAGLTQAELAQKLYIDRSLISLIELGRSPVGEERLQAIAEITGIDFGSSEETENH